MFVDGKPVLEIKDFGDSEALLRNGPHLKGAAQALVKCGIIPDEDGWGEWLGRYQAVLRRRALAELDRGRRSKEPKIARKRRKSHER
jgi:hypothetical protein